MTSLAPTSFTTRIVPRFESCPPPPPGGQVRTAPVVTPPATGAGDFLQDREAASRLVHTQETAGASPAPATRSVRQTTPGRSAPAVRASDESTASHSCAGGVGSAARETAPAYYPKPPAQAGAVNLSEASVFILSLVAAHEGRAPEDILAQLIAAAADAIGIHSLIMRDAGEVDLADLPDFALRAANRFRGGGP